MLSETPGFSKRANEVDAISYYRDLSRSKINKNATIKTSRKLLYHSRLLEVEKERENQHCGYMLRSGFSTLVLLLVNV